MALLNEAEASKWERLYEIMREKNFKVGQKLHFLPDQIGAEVWLTDDEVIHFPVIILYDESMQSDLIQDFGTNTTFKE